MTKQQKFMISGAISNAIVSQINYNKKKWNLVWIVDGKIKETILTNAERNLCYWEKRKLENSTHTMGKLVLVECK